MAGLPLDAAAIEALERATVQAVSPQRVEQLPGWLLPMDGGTVGRARSAVPLHHAAPDLRVAATVLNTYRAARTDPRWRLPDLPAFDGLHRWLGRHGFERTQPTLTQVADIRDAGGPVAVAAEVQWRLQPQACADWLALYLGADFDPVDGSHRAQALARAAGTWFASAVVQGQTVACGAASLSQGWLGVHGMRTVSAWRGRGLAAALVRHMAALARSQGIERAFLQVDSENRAAQSVYRRLGFTTAWTYAYWRVLATD